MSGHRVVSGQEWQAARQDHLVKEKELTRLRDQLSQQRRALPWERVDKKYVFDGPEGKESLPEMFDGRSQLIVYHFMFHPDWGEGCPHCSFWADNFNGIITHLNHRDATMLVISRAPLAQLEAFKKRMGWSFTWLSSFDSDFNFDYQVSSKAEGAGQGEIEESGGINVFHKNEGGDIFHTYSCYARGLDMLNGAYHYLDLLPKGRDEAGLTNTQAWVRHHDRYEERPFGGRNGGEAQAGQEPRMHG